MTPKSAHRFSAVTSVAKSFNTSKFINSFGDMIINSIIEEIQKGYNELMNTFIQFIEKYSKEGISWKDARTLFKTSIKFDRLLEAKKIGLGAQVIPGISIYSFLGATGLDQYRFGRTCTIVAPQENYAPESFYDVIEKNFQGGLHTLCLLDIDAEHSKMMSVGEALGILVKIERKRGRDLLQRATLIGLFGMGSAKQMVKVGELQSLQRSGFALFPQSLVIAAPLTDKEKEALGELHG